MMTKSSKIQELQDHIKLLENELLETQDRVNAFCADDQILCFRNGEYSNSVQEVYKDLLCMGVGTANVEEIIHTVLKKLANMECDRFPKPTFSKYMLLEARALSQIQVADTVLKDWDTAHNTLASDGTSKYNKSYITYDITRKDGIDLCLGFHETGNGAAEEH